MVSVIENSQISCSVGDMVNSV